MGRVVMREVVQPVFGAGNEVVIEPGTRFPDGHEFTPDVSWREVIADAPGPEAAAEPKQATTVKAEAASGKGAAHK